MKLFSALEIHFCHKKQETEGCRLKLCGHNNHHGTYTLQAGTSYVCCIFYRLPVLVPYC